MLSEKIVEKKKEVLAVKKNFYDLSLQELEEFFLSFGKEKFRARQLFRWVYKMMIEDFSKMTDLSKLFRKELVSLFEFHLPKVLLKKKSKDGTEKFLFDVGEGLSVESVLIPSLSAKKKPRLTLCLSSEVGCPLACQFCFTGKQKLKKRLLASHIVGQYMNASKNLKTGERITNIVFMGMGEPLDNSEAVFRAIEILSSPLGLSFPRKKITLSTAGLVPKIPLVTRSGVRLAVSLNATDNEVRSRLMPINKKWPLEKLLEVSLQHTKESGDKVTFEYILIKNLTDSLKHAEELFNLTASIPCKINIIPFNPHPHSGFLEPEEHQVDLFQRALIEKGAHVLRRKTRGDDIFAACGQLNSLNKNVISKPC